MFGIALTVPFTAQAADLFAKAPLSAATTPLQGGPAVDGFNGKFGGFGGTFAHQSIGGVEGSFSAPLGYQYGLQIDAVAASWDSKFFGHIAGHAFWREPTRALVGIYAAHSNWDKFSGVDVNQVGFEGEYYWQRWTVQGVAGVEFGNTATQTVGAFFESIDVKTRFFDQVNLAYYLNDDWKAFIGHRYLGGKNALALGTEYGFPIGGGRMAALFVEGRVGEGDFTGIWGGVKLYFGQKDKSLIRRHREDDPPGWGVNSAGGASNSAKPPVAILPAGGGGGVPCYGGCV